MYARMLSHLWVSVTEQIVLWYIVLWYIQWSDYGLDISKAAIFFWDKSTQDKILFLSTRLHIPQIVCYEQSDNSAWKMTDDKPISM
jgi:hypothetical protein